MHVCIINVYVYVCVWRNMYLWIPSTFMFVVLALNFGMPSISGAGSCSGWALRNAPHLSSSTLDQQDLVFLLSPTVLKRPLWIKHHQNGSPCILLFPNAPDFDAGGRWRNGCRARHILIPCEPETRSVDVECLGGKCLRKWHQVSSSFPCGSQGNNISFVPGQDISRLKKGIQIYFEQTWRPNSFFWW